MTSTVSTTGKFTCILGGLAAATALSAFWSLPTAAASCVSAFGLGTNPDCTSTIASVAVAVGTGAQAHADGLLGTAFAFGDNAGAFANKGGLFNIAFATGTNGAATTAGVAAIGIALGTADAGVVVGVAPNSYFNIAIGLGNKSTTVALGTGNIAVSLFGQGQQVRAAGRFNTALNVGGKGNYVEAQGTLSSAVNLTGSDNDVSTRTTDTLASTAFNLIGSNNAVAAGPGPLAIAGSIAQNGATNVKVGPGININGFVIGGAAAVNPAKAADSRPTNIKAVKTDPRPAAVSHSRNNA